MTTIYTVSEFHGTERHDWDVAYPDLDSAVKATCDRIGDYWHQCHVRVLLDEDYADQVLSPTRVRKLVGDAMTNNVSIAYDDNYTAAVVLSTGMVDVTVTINPVTLAEPKSRDCNRAAELSLAEQLLAELRRPCWD